MKNFGATSSSGQASQTILFLGGIIVIIAIAVFALTSFLPKFSSGTSKSREETKEEESIYEIVAGDIKFKLVEAKDLGNTLKASEKKIIGWQDQDAVTKEKFVEVTISAENIGKETIQADYWDINELVDVEGRRFSSSPELKPWISEESQCGALLKPGFSPTPCTTIYEVAKISVGLKAKISIKSPSAIRQGNPEEFYINLGI